MRLRWNHRHRRRGRAGHAHRAGAGAGQRAEAAPGDRPHRPPAGGGVRPGGTSSTASSSRTAPFSSTPPRARNGCSARPSPATWSTSCAGAGSSRWRSAAPSAPRASRHLETIRGAIRDLGLSLDTVVNRGGVVVLPVGVSKASGTAQRAPRGGGDRGGVRRRRRRRERPPHARPGRVRGRRRQRPGRGQGGVRPGDVAAGRRRASPSWPPASLADDLAAALAGFGGWGRRGPEPSSAAGRCRAGPGRLPDRASHQWIRVNGVAEP